MAENAVALLDDRAGFGPAMRALRTDRQRRFVQVLTMTGCDAAKAARQAGYSDVKEAAKVRAHELTHDPKVQAAILEESQKYSRALVPRALKVLADIAFDKSAPLSERRRCAEGLLDRGGLHALSEHKMTVEHKTDAASQIERIVALSKALNRPELARELLGPHGIVLDAEYKIISGGEGDKAEAAE